MIYSNLKYENGTLTIAGVPATSLAEQYGTPLYVCDEDMIRANCAKYTRALSVLNNGSHALYASKALSFKRIYGIVSDEGLGADVVSGGEFYTAVSAGADRSAIYFHGNNKSLSELEFAVREGIGCVVVNDINEARTLNGIALKSGKKQKTMLRVTPCIDPHTFKQVCTGQLDSKFGTTIETGEAREAVGYIASAEGLSFCGCHCHIGSQIFEAQPFLDALNVMLDFCGKLRDEDGVICEELNLGGGIAVRYTENDGSSDIEATVGIVVKALAAECEKRSYPIPKLLLEPGRSIVANAGVTLYTVGSIKDIPGVRKYVSIDGGMADNPRFALYGAVHSALKASNCGTKPAEKVTIAGKSCESGDIVAEDAVIEQVETGDLLAVLGTGAYNYSMASNYNRLPKPAVVMISKGQTYVAVKRETYEDLVRNDM